MKKFFTTLSAGLLFSATSFAQVGATAPDFNVTDLDGNSHDLYEMLDSGFVVILDCSATWCGPCWGFHSGHYLQDIHETYGPGGTNQVRVIFYEADAATTLADLEGTGSSTQGDWLAGSTYPFINEAPLQLSGSVYWPLGFPTINVISPSDKKIKADLWDTYAPGGTLADMVDVIDDYFAIFASVENAAISNLSVYPNPAINTFAVTYSASNAGSAKIEIYNMLGQVALTTTSAAVAGTNNVTFDASNLEAGQYIAKITLDNKIENIKFNVIK